jgi:hypothetical protein
MEPSRRELLHRPSSFRAPHLSCMVTACMILLGCLRLLVSCGALESAHAAALHADRLFIARDSISGATAQRSKLERALKPLRGGWVHELWCADLMIIGVIFIAHPQLQPQNSRLHVLIGSALTMGAHLMAADKVQGHPNLRTVMAGVCFGTCSVALRAFEETKEVGARGGLSMSASNAISEQRAFWRGIWRVCVWQGGT